mgnify:CR=1 FL=1
MAKKNSPFKGNVLNRLSHFKARPINRDARRLVEEIEPEERGLSSRIEEPLLPTSAASKNKNICAAKITKKTRKCPDCEMEIRLSKFPFELISHLKGTHGRNPSYVELNLYTPGEEKRKLRTGKKRKVK